MKLIILLLFTGCAFGDIVRRDVGDSAWDELIDQALDAAREDIISNHFDLIHVPDIDNELHQHILGIPISIMVKIQGAEFWNVSTVSRRGPVTVLQDDVTGNITISTSLGLDKFAFNCKQLYVHIFGLTVSGSLDSECASNSLDFSLSLITDKEGVCKAYVNWARLAKFQQFTVQILPSGVINWLAEHISSFILNNFSSKLLAIVNANLADEINAVIGKIDVCSYIPI